MTGIKYCPNCGKKLEDAKVNYCKKCGWKKDSVGNKRSVNNLTAFSGTPLGKLLGW